MSGVYYKCKVKELLEDLEKDELFTSPHIINRLRALDPEKEIGVSAETCETAVVDIYEDIDNED